MKSTKGSCPYFQARSEMPSALLRSDPRAVDLPRSPIPAPSTPDGLAPSGLLAQLVQEMSTLPRPAPPANLDIALSARPTVESVPESAACAPAPVADPEAADPLVGVV